MILSGVLHGQTLNTIYSFGHNKLGSQPTTGVVIGAGGELYGTTSHGGNSGLGIAYELVPPTVPDGAWTQIALHSFGANGVEGYPGAGLLLGPGNALYGVTHNGAAGAGNAFRLVPWEATGQAWPEVTLHVFTGTGGDGAEPETPLALGPNGVLYGTTSTGAIPTGGTV
ncbi:MAG TPA: choice-of-anchor tandem repeat GloVer-containing protein, partial [Bryobacteraceae bacterium]|nr:choice-of-anchor tandem repeat GloVer-containing protein [Bryobacteraceae bacterium]